MRTDNARRGGAQCTANRQQKTAKSSEII